MLMNPYVSLGRVPCAFVNICTVSTILDALAKLLLDTLENKMQEAMFVNSEYYGMVNFYCFSHCSFQYRKVCCGSR